MEDRDCDWYCDYCHAYLNNQSGFTTISESWVCEYCGNVNDVSDNNIIPDEGTHGRYVYETTYEDGTTEKIRFTKKYEVHDFDGPKGKGKVYGERKNKI